MEATKRKEWIDVFKFLGIYAIYIGHYGEAAGRLYLFVFAFHVQLFFFAGGFFFKQPKIKEWRSFFFKNAKRLLIPYFIFSFIVIFLNALYYNYSYLYIKELLYLTLLGRRGSVPASALWFLTCYFTVIVIYALLGIIFRKKWIKFFVCYILYAFHGQILTFFSIQPLSLVFNLDSAINYLVFFAAGDCLFYFLDKIELNKNFNTKNILCWILFGCSGLTTMVVYFTDSTYLSGIWPSFINRFGVGLFIQTILLITFFCIISKWLVHVPFIQELGRNTLILCGCETSTRQLVMGITAIFRGGGKSIQHSLIL